MRTKRGISIGVIILGLILIFISQHIQHRINEGEGQISSGQSQLDESRSLFNWNPVTKEIGKGMTSGAEARIEAGEEEVAHYQSIANTLLVLGIILVVLGVIGVVAFELRWWGRRRR